MRDAQHQSSGFQEKFAHEDAFQFQSATRMARTAGTILSLRLGRSEQDAACFGDVLVLADLTEDGDGDLHRTIKEVAEASDANLSASEIQSIIEEARLQSAAHSIQP